MSLSNKKIVERFLKGKKTSQRGFQVRESHKGQAFQTIELSYYHKTIAIKNGGKIILCLPYQYGRVDKKIINFFNLIEKHCFETYCFEKVKDNYYINGKSIVFPKYSEYVYIGMTMIKKQKPNWFNRRLNK